MKAGDIVVFTRKYDPDEYPFYIPQGFEGEVLDDPFGVDDEYQVTVGIMVEGISPEIDGKWEVTVPREIVVVVAEQEVE
ncbi:MAG TPA: hypothetical protein ENG09_00150 [Candidatus Syntrophoarchaeum butanivorans]|uniref:Uncharacterized protein n=1 Tax=Candidatus Syntropharchaeum butanivorans TaxID=1839936 RepID=A0A7C0X005_9EURY|nr:hypothetical protein [Candidatus Syntrophoarchaeum butanivorans]